MSVSLSPSHRYKLPRTTQGESSQAAPLPTEPHTNAKEGGARRREGEKERKRLEKEKEKSANFNLRINKYRESVMRKSFLDKFIKEGESAAR